MGMRLFKMTTIEFELLIELGNKATNTGNIYATFKRGALAFLGVLLSFLLLTDTLLPY